MSAEIPGVQCSRCKWLNEKMSFGDAEPSTGSPGGWFGCAAFDHIPREIREDVFDHRQPHEGDHGIRWEGADGATHPLDRSARATASRTGTTSTP